MSKDQKRFACTLVIGVLMGILPLCLERLSDGSVHPLFRVCQYALIALSIPGMFGAIAIGGNVHAWHIWQAALVNAGFYAGLTWIALNVFGKKA